MRYVSKIILIMLAVLGIAAPTYAATQCYSDEEARAEQWLRLHSELMVITVTCHQSSKGLNLIPYYTGFTKAHIDTLHDAEQTLIKHYQAGYGGDGIDRLDKLRTKLANEFGQIAADATPPKFCAARRDKVLVMYKASEHELEAEIQTPIAGAKPYERMCDAHIAKKAR